MSDDFSIELSEEEVSGEYSLTATGIAEYIRFNCCPRFFKLRVDHAEEQSRRWHEAFKPISPLLYAVGKKLEETKISEIQQKARKYFSFDSWSARKSMPALREVIESQIASKEQSDYIPVLVYQAKMKGHVGIWDVSGIADLIAIWPLKNGKVKVRIFELKSSYKEQTAHRIQVAIYVLLLRKELSDLSSIIQLEGGVINRETPLINLDAGTLPIFKLGPLTQDVERLLANKGELNRIHKTALDMVEYQLSGRCENCGFNECCIVNAVEKESITLLNLTRGEQHALRKYGIEKIEDLAKLKVLLDTVRLYPYDFKAIPAKDPKKAQELSTDPVIGGKVDWLVERAQYMLGGIRPSSPYASKIKYMPWLIGTGYGTIPDDKPSNNIDSPLLHRVNGLIRIYIFIQWDYMLDVISIVSAKVSCTLYKGEPLLISKVIDTLPDEQEDCFKAEKRMMESFFKSLTEAITKIANEIGSPDEAPIHLYFFSRQERDALMRTVCRHRELISLRAIRDLLGLRQAIDQPMFSIIQEEVQRRKALKFHSSGLLPILEQATWFEHKNWTVKRKDGSTIDLSTVFKDGFFNYTLPFHRNPDKTISFLTKKDSKPDGFYPVRARFSDQLPIEYVWGVKGRLDNYNVEGVAKIMLEKRKWCDVTRIRRITDEELALMAEKICFALEVIEDSLTIRNRRLGKKAINVPKIEAFTLGEATLESACREFLDLENFSKRQEMYLHYALLPYQRVATGRSLIFQCTNVVEVDREFTVHGKLIYEGIGLPRADYVSNACRVKGIDRSDSSSSGDWMIVTELRRDAQGQFEELQKRSPSEIAKSAQAIVDSVDVNKLEIIVKIITWRTGKGSKYIAWHNLPTTDPEEARNSQFKQLFEIGRYYILDDIADDIVSDRAAKSLDNAGNNVLYRLLADYLSEKTCNSSHVPLNPNPAEGFLRWVEARKLPPKPEQKRFIDQIFSKEPIIMLQGPPGTGKTETLQLTVLAHVAAHRSNSRCRVLMVAPTHRAIQEFVAKLSSCWQEYTTQGGRDLKDLRIYRVINSDPTLSPRLEGVKYFNYNEDEDVVKELSDSLLNQVSLTPNSTVASPLVLCLTPPGLYALMKKIGDKEPPWGQGFFDLLVVDEASMMRLPELILSGSFMTKSSQILVAGDHRQLPPIMAHNWEKEDRRTLEEMASFLSAMDFLRLLRNEDLGIERIVYRHPANIPAERLCESHRCHSVVADFLREWVYEKDKIDFRSDQKETLPSPQAKTAGLGVALESDNVFVLVVHDEAESFQSNRVEAEIVNGLVQSAPTNRIGIITPHNAQKGLLKNLLSVGSKDIRVDTVERYQGGEADFIIISSCVSDPDYVRTESDFLLNLNRINVAISRMKKKIVIVASRSIFEFMPQDARDYDKALLWRGICETVGFTADSTPKWAGLLGEFLGAEASPVKVEVYVKSTR